MSFQASEHNERNFLKLLNDDLNSLKPLAIKGSLWLQYFGHSTSLCARVTWAIINHAPIGEYWLRFFPRKDFLYPCELYPIETRWHILHEYKRFNNYWNFRRDTIAYFSLFLKLNSNAFSFGQDIIFLSLFLLPTLFFYLFPPVTSVSIYVVTK